MPPRQPGPCACPATACSRCESLLGCGVTSPTPSPTPSQSPRPTADLLKLLAPVMQRIAELDIAGKDSDAQHVLTTLRSTFPRDGDDVAAIGAQIAQGVEAGWLCHRGEASARFSRVAKPGPDTHQLSVDIVSLEGPAQRHSHPTGEITLAFAAPGSNPEQVRFDGHKPGWVLMPSGSSHTPTVSEGRMYLLYFLPGGAIQWEA